MESNVEADSALQYASIQILSGQQRYDAYICVDNKVEKLLSGNLDDLLPFMPALKELYSKGSTCNFTLQLPENMHGSGWFTKLTFERFLCIVNTPSLVAKTKLINQEITQLEAGRKFQLSLFSKTGAGVPSSDPSREALLHAMDSRLEALTGELVAAFTQNASAIFSEKELISLADFPQLFGATDLENALHRFLETRSWIAVSKSENRNSDELVAKNQSKSGSEISVACSQPDTDEACVKYSVPPTKVAEIERQSSGCEEESSDTDGEGQWTSAERNRTLMRSALHRRSTSPMRRVQIGRSGSQRAVALNMKSLGYFPVRSVTHTETCENDDEDSQGSDQISKKVKNEIRKMSVQDKIRIFECRQTDQSVDIRKRRSSANFSVGETKLVLRRWSSGSSHDEAETVGKVSPLGNSGEAIPEEPEASLAGKTEFQIEYGNLLHSSEAAKDEKMRENEDQGSKSISSSLEEMSVCNRLASSTEWSQKNEVELRQMMMEMMENNSVTEKSELSRRQDNPVEQRGSFYDKYKQKRDERLRGKNTGSKAEKLAQFKVMQEVLNEKRAEILFLDAKDGKRATVKKPPKSLKNSSAAAAKPKKENHELLKAKKASARTASSLPADRKSWPLTPTSRTAGVSPGNGSRTPSPARIKPSHQKPLLVSSVPTSICSRLNQEQFPAIQKVVKQETRVRKLKDGVDEKPQSVPEAGRTGKAKLSKGSSPSNGCTVVTKKLSFYNKGTNKSSVVPLDSKLTRKSSGSNPLLKKETKVSETFMDDCQDSKEEHNDYQDSEEHCHKQSAADSDMVNLMETADSPSVEPPGATNMEPEVLEIKAHECDKEESLDDGRNGLPRVTDAASVSNQTEEEADISQMTWVKIEESTDIPPLEDDCTFEFIPCANIPPCGSLSPRVRHSLSQMLQEEEENSEPDTSGWGNAENPPSLRYQRKSPSKGLRKLLNKFARKGKGDVNLSGGSSPSTFLEGEDDIEDTKIQTMKSSDNLLKERMSGFAVSRDGISSSTGPTMAKAFRGSNRTADA